MYRVLQIHECAILKLVDHGALWLSTEKYSCLLDISRSSLLTSRNVRCHRVACPLLSHGEYADETYRQMDGRQTVTLGYSFR